MFRSKPTVGSVCGGMCRALPPPRIVLIRRLSLWRSTTLEPPRRAEHVPEQTL